MTTKESLCYIRRSAVMMPVVSDVVVEPVARFCIVVVVVVVVVDDVVFLHGIVDESIGRR